jgi:hypothetical protein
MQLLATAVEEHECSLGFSNASLAESLRKIRTLLFLMAVSVSFCVQCAFTFTFTVLLAGVNDVRVVQGKKWSTGHRWSVELDILLPKIPVFVLYCKVERAVCFPSQEPRIFINRENMSKYTRKLKSRTGEKPLSCLHYRHYPNPKK